VIVIFRLFSRRAAESKPTNARFTTHDNQRFALPGIVLDSCKKVCAPHRLPARIGGALVKPPIAKTASGRFVLNTLFAAPYDFLNPRKNAISPPRCNPIAGNVTISIPDADFTPSWSTSFGEINNVTAHPRCKSFSATDSPGNKCPPVPPQAIAIAKSDFVIWIRVCSGVNFTVDVAPNYARCTALRWPEQLSSDARSTARFRHQGLCNDSSFHHSFAPRSNADESFSQVFL
jgi:hypothetical protein